MARLGEMRLLPAREEDPDSKWVTEDYAPGGLAGYYIKAIVPIPHRVLRDSKAAAFEWSIGEMSYRIRCSHLPTFEDNLTEAFSVFDTIEDWISRGVFPRENIWRALRYGAPRPWWSILRAPPDATRDEIHEAFRRRALIVHPDRGGSNEAFLELKKAYEEALR